MRRNLIAAAITAALMVAAVVVVLLVPSTDRVDDPPDSSASERATPVPLDDLVTTASGPVRGISDGTLDAWLGLPYAAPPTGKLRWRPPREPVAWDDVREASSFGDSCVQPVKYTFGESRLTQRPGTSEDCLFLNVVRPGGDRDDDLPVVVWLHGGGFFAGSGNSAAADAGALVKRGIVLVTVNYRLGRLGFFGHPALDETIANFGLLDQVAALAWVRDNIAAFGGDPANVTLAGGSAGAMSVDALMAMPRADGLFQRAIAQSAPSDARSLTLDRARERGARSFPGLSAKRLRALPPEELLSSTFNTLSGDAPIVDSVLPVTSAEAFADGTEQDVPYLVGTTAEEFSDDDYRAFGVDPDELRESLGGEDHDTLVVAYGDGDSYERDVLDDVVFDLPSIERAATHGTLAPTYRYVFRSSDYSGHGAEGAYVFDTVTGGREGRLSDAMADYWVAFARTGRPVVAGLPRWPRAGADDLSAFLTLAPDGPTPHPTDPLATRLAVLRDSLS